MAITFGAMAQVATQSALAVGQSQASSMGLGKQEGNALALTSMLGGQDEGKNMVQTLMGKTGTNRLRGQGLKNDLMAIGQAALSQKTGGLGLGGSGMGGSGTLLSLKV